MRRIAVKTGMISITAMAICWNLSKCGWADNQDKSRERKDAERIRNASKALNNAKENSQNAAQELAQSVQALKNAEKERDTRSAQVRKLRESLRDEHEHANKLPAALERQKEAQNQFNIAASPVLIALKATTDYLKAAEIADKAKKLSDSVRQDKSLSQSARDDKLSELTKEILQPGVLEQQAIQADAKASAARSRLESASGQVADIRKRVTAAVEKDPKLLQAQQALDAANTDIDKVKAEIQKRQRLVGQSQQKVDQEQRDLQRAKNQDKSNDKPRRNK